MHAIVSESQKTEKENDRDRKGEDRQGEHKAATDIACEILSYYRDGASASSHEEGDGKKEVRRTASPIKPLSVKKHVVVVSFSMVKHPGLCKGDYLSNSKCFRVNSALKCNPALCGGY